MGYHNEYILYEEAEQRMVTANQHHQYQPEGIIYLKQGQSLAANSIAV